MGFFRRLWDRLRPATPKAAHMCTEDEPYNPIMLTHRFMQPPPRPCDDRPARACTCGTSRWSSRRPRAATR